MKRIPTKLAAAALAVLLHALLIPRVCGAAAPTGVTEFDTAPAKGNAAIDAGLSPTAVAALGDFLWLGRKGGIRKYDRLSGSWEFFPYKGLVCPGVGTINIVPEPPYLWTRLNNTGSLCRFDPGDGSWFSMKDWTVLARTGQGGPVGFSPDYIYIASQGSPDWEGVNVIDRVKGEWVKLLPTKPITAMYLDPRYIWLGVSEGILRINRVTEDYTYYLPSEHGGGAVVTDILPVPQGIAFATTGDHTSILGDETRVTKKSIQVYMKNRNRWYTYLKSDREKLLKDLQNGTIKPTYIKTRPGLLILSGGKWRLLTVSNGLASNNITSLDRDSKCLYVATLRGITALDISTLKPRDINPHIFRALLQAHRVVSDREFLWVITNRGLFRVTKSSLFSFPR